MPKPTIKHSREAGPGNWYHYIEVGTINWQCPYFVHNCSGAKKMESGCLRIFSPWTELRKSQSPDATPERSQLIS